MPNFCINFLNKAAKLLSISYDFAVAPSSDAWIKTGKARDFNDIVESHPPRMRGLKHTIREGIISLCLRGRQRSSLSRILPIKQIFCRAGILKGEC